MKRKLEEVKGLIKQKIENAQNDIVHEMNRKYPSHKKMLRLQGEVEAYQDVLILLETSELWYGCGLV